MKNSILTILLWGTIILGIVGCKKVEVKDFLETPENGYKLVTTLKNQNINLTELVRVNGNLYSKSPGLLDYLGNDNPIGVIDKLIDEIYIPKLDFETNNQDLLNAKVFADNKNSIIVLYYNDEYVLFEKVIEK